LLCISDTRKCMMSVIMLFQWINHWWNSPESLSESSGSPGLEVVIAMTTKCSMTPCSRSQSYTYLQLLNDYLLSLGRA
jgi:hypothetical protein